MLRHRVWQTTFCIATVLAVTAQLPFSTATAQDIEALQQKIEQLEKRITELERLQTAPVDMLEQPQMFALPDDIQPKQLLSTEPDSLAEAPTTPGAADTDGDGLTDIEETQLRTSRTNPDTDGDGLLDGWEVHGVNGINLRAMGASPRHKDIFIEMDFMVRATATRSLAPSDAVLGRIRQVFANAPVSNPDGTQGINIHLERGNEVPHDADLNPYQTEFFALKAAHFKQDRAPVFHYMIWADAYNSGSSSGVAMGIPHSDFVVTLGRWGGGTGGTEDEKVGTFIHELGHTLGLTHGGSDHMNFKPNHISVMNYAFQTRGIEVGNSRSFGYQSFTLPTLRENLLSETAGLSAGTLVSGYKTIIAPTRVVNASGPIDWNGNGVIDSTRQRMDINADTFVGDLLSTPNQWNSLIYNGGSIGSRGTLADALSFAESVSEPFPYIELTEEMNRMLAP